jgi:hypothetical protein
VRKFLVGGTTFPHEIMAVVVIVCSDSEGRSVWGLPSQVHEAGCENYRFITRGVIFRVLIGSAIPAFFRDGCCLSPRQCIFYGDSAHRIKADFAPFFEGMKA